MKTLGLIGGLSWHSTADYYRIINEEIQRRIGGLNSATLLLYSLNFQEIIDLQNRNEMNVIQDKLTHAGHVLKAGGAEAIVLCANTVHLFADAVQAAVSLPLVHIVDAT